MDAYLLPDLYGDLLALGGVGFVVGVVFPLGFKVLGYIVDSAMVVVKDG